MKRAVATVCLFIIGLALLQAQGNFRLASVFGDGMVLQQNAEVLIWGTASPGAKVSVKPSWIDRKIFVQTSSDGRWECLLPTLAASSAAYGIEIESEKKTLTIDNVRFGEVWLCSGQSNMEMTVGPDYRQNMVIENVEEEIATADYPEIHFINVRKNEAFAPVEDIITDGWKVCSPETVPQLSAVGYYFARKLYQELDVPIGLLMVPYGGSPVQAWLPAGIASDDPFYEAEVRRVSKCKETGASKPNFNMISSLYNGMLSPVVGYGIKGFLWYQGESNVSESARYPRMMQDLISSWREGWKNDRLPFYQVQLAPYVYPSNELGMWSNLSWAQQKVAETTDNCGLVVISDLGDDSNIHPPKKKPVGERLAALVLNDVYCRADIESRFPEVESVSSSGPREVRIKFKNVYDGLHLDGAWNEFEVSADGVLFARPECAIESKDIITLKTNIDGIKYVRYCWRDNCRPNLFNSADLPAGPFYIEVPDLNIDLIPYPAIVERKSGIFTFDGSLHVYLKNIPTEAGKLYLNILEEAVNQDLTVSDDAEVKFIVENRLDIPKEGYEIEVDRDGIEVRAAAENGLFYGVRTLVQLMIDSNGKFRSGIPYVYIKDYPRFDWRGCMLDVSRTFMPKSVLFRYIDLMSQYKLNKLHLHLTDDQGWRLEIHQYPELTRVGSKFEAKYNEMGGYYTQKDMKDIIEYAASRNVEIVPEIEMPGHAVAAIASYPELSCRNVTPEIHPFFEGPGIHEEIFCAGNPDVYEFIYNVLDEVIALFPSQYIHIGGDEAPKSEWEKCPKCQSLLKEKGLTTEAELQGYFVSEVEKYLTSKGKTLIGWDEISECGGLNGNEVIMFWRSEIADRIPELVRQNGCRIIACPTEYCYFDYDYTETDTQEVYQYEPIPPSLEFEYANCYIGIQANFWSHIDRSEANIDEQLFPRLFALSEIGWSSDKDWERFKSAAITHCSYLARNKVNSYPDPVIFNSINH